MKNKLRKILSLVMVLAMVCGMVSTSMAAEWWEPYEDYIDWDNDPVDDDNADDCYYRGYHLYVVYDSVNDRFECEHCGEWGTLDDRYYDDDYDYSDHDGYYNHDVIYEYYNDDYHDIYCLDCEDYVDYERHSVGNDGYCIYCDERIDDYYYDEDIDWYKEDDTNDTCYYRGHDPLYWEEEGGYVYFYCSRTGCDAEGRIDADYYDYDHEYEYDDDEYHIVYCYDDTCRYHDDDWDYEEHTLGSDGYCYYCEELIDEDYYGAELILDPYDTLYGYTYRDGDTEKLEVYAEVLDEDGDDISSYYTFDFTWSGDYTGAVEDTYDSYAYLKTNLDCCEVTCTVTATPKRSSGYNDVLTGEVVWYAAVDDILVAEVVVYNDARGFDFDEYDDENDYSIEEQIIDALEYLDEDNVLESVKFGSVKVTGKGELDVLTTDDCYYDYSDAPSGAELLGDVTFYPVSTYVGTVSFPFVATYLNYANAERTVNGVVIFDVKDGSALSTGSEVVYTALDGEDVTLDEDDFEEFWAELYPNGTLDYVRFTSVSSGKIYADGSDKALKTGSTGDKCYLDPTSRQNGMDQLVYEPAKNTTTATIKFEANGATRSNKTTGKATGTITILYTAEEVDTIEYVATGSEIYLDADDFAELYKEVMDPTNFKANKLTIQFTELPEDGTLYDASGRTDVALTGKNMSSYTYSASTSATRSIDDVYYEPSGSVGDVAQYACYYDGVLKYFGEIMFTAADPVVIELTCGGAMAFKTSDFAKTELSKFGFILFGNPSSGTLYTNYSATGGGTKVSTGTPFTRVAGANSVSNVTFVPYVNFAGTVEIPFYAFNEKEVYLPGTIKITVSKSFPDLQASDPRYGWAVPYAARLNAAGVVGGDDKGNVNPGQNVKYGEALKMIMIAAGYPEQPSKGYHWADGYLAKAYADGLVDPASVPNSDKLFETLQAPVDRLTMASIACKAIGLSKATSIKYGVVGPTDTTDGYVYAMYNAGILGGSYVNGKNVYLPNNSITRAAIFKIVCGVMDNAK